MASTTLETNTIPVIDIDQLYNKTTLSLEDTTIISIAEKFGNALHGCGFAYLVNHGIPENCISDAFKESKTFFELSPELKEKYLKADVAKNYHGYARPGQESLSDSVQELKESFDIFANNRYYPSTEVPRFETALETLENACRSLDVKLLELLAISIKLEDTSFFNDTCQNLDDRSVPSLNTFRTLFYPPIPEDVKPGAIRCAEHTDYGIISLLFQDPAGGLQVKSAQNEWIHADYIPNSIIVNTGDLLEAWTGGYFPATPHRVLVPETEIQKKSTRQSMAFFLHPDNDVKVSLIENEFIQKHKSPTFKEFQPISAFDHAMDKVKLSYGKY